MGCKHSEKNFNVASNPLQMLTGIVIPGFGEFGQAEDHRIAGVDLLLMLLDQQRGQAVALDTDHLHHDRQ